MATFRHIIVLLMVASVLAACGGAPAANTQSTAAPEDQAITTAPAAAEATSTAGPATEPMPTAEATTESAAQGAGEAPLPPEGTATTAAAPADGDIKAALQKTVDVWSQAYNEADPELLGQAIDPNARALGRTQRDLVKYYSESQGLARDWKGTVAEVEQLEQGYVLAYVDIGSARYPMTFKQVDGQWLLSEPRRAELGKKKEIETEHFTFEYYPWDEAIGPEIAQMMEEAHKSIVEKMGRAPDKKSRVRLNPTTEVALTSGGVLAFYRRGSGAQQGTKEMVINSPRSFAAGGFNAEAGWQADLLVTLAHEYAHLVNDCCFTPIFRQNDWMTEGLAVYISEGGHTNGYMPRVIFAVKNDSVIPIRGETRNASNVRQDLENLSELDKDKGLGYGLAATLVDYIVTNYGGLDGYWKLVGEYDKTQNFDQALQNVLGITFEEFDRGWREDLKKRYAS